MLCWGLCTNGLWIICPTFPSLNISTLNKIKKQNECVFLGGGLSSKHTHKKKRSSGLALHRCSGPQRLLTYANYTSDKYLHSTSSAELPLIWHTRCARGPHTCCGAIFYKHYRSQLHQRNMTIGECITLHCITFLQKVMQSA